MTRLLISIVVACCFLIPAVALAGNTAPKLYLEIWQYAEVPDPIPDATCVHSVAVPPAGIPCYSAKAAYNSAVVAIHIGNLNQPVCPIPGAGCTNQGGFLGLSFGVQASGEAITFMSWTACPGFLKGPSIAGEPSACLASSTEKCHDWQDHLGYLQYTNLSTRTGVSNLTIVAAADPNPLNVINCTNTYDGGTTVGGSAQWGGTQAISCATTAVASSSWGNIKNLFR